MYVVAKECGNHVMNASPDVFIRKYFWSEHAY